MTAMEAIHSDVAILKDQVESLLPLKSEVAVLKEHVESLLPLKGDVRKLLNHFGLVAGDAP
ncbi:MAG: hypothetical protein OXJ90_13465 [Spirochaetaceae bacterium]|nr:hypothetical protein [Spirochaetaceae bacterium]